MQGTCTVFPNFPFDFCAQNFQELKWFAVGNSSILGFSGNFPRKFPCHLPPFPKMVLRALSIQPKIPKITNRDNWYGNFLGKFPENPDIVEFPKREPYSKHIRIQQLISIEISLMLRAVHSISTITNVWKLVRRICILRRY